MVRTVCTVSLVLGTPLKENVFESLCVILQYFKVKTTDKVRNQSPQIKFHFYFTLNNSGEMTGASFLFYSISSSSLRIFHAHTEISYSTEISIGKKKAMISGHVQPS